MEKWNIPIANIRGQGYDNRAHMYRGKVILKYVFESKSSYFLAPYSAHTLNLIISGVSNLNSNTILFYLYGINQEKSMKLFVKLLRMRILLKKFNMKLEVCAPN